MTIVLVILAVLILLAVLFLIRRINQVSNSILSAMADRYSNIINHFINLNDNVNTKVNTVTTVVGSQQEEVVRLTNKVEESNNCNKAAIDNLKHTVLTLNDRLTAPIDKINDTHNRIKTLGKGATSTDELRTVVTEIVSAITTEAVDAICDKCAPKPKTTKKVTKEPIKEGKL